LVKAERYHLMIIKQAKKKTDFLDCNGRILGKHYIVGDEYMVFRSQVLKQFSMIRSRILEMF
jgi:hypothetical protein